LSYASRVGRRQANGPHSAEAGE